MSDHSDMVARLRFHANMIQDAEAIRRVRSTSDTACYVDPMAKVLHEAADALDVKQQKCPECGDKAGTGIHTIDCSFATLGPNADLVKAARNMSTWSSNYWQQSWIRRFADALEKAEAEVRRLETALESANSRARVLPTREQIAKTISMAEERVMYPDDLPTDEDGPLECHYEAADDVLALLTGGKADG